MTGDAMTVRLCHLYPELMNIYADRGNIAVFERRLGWRGHSLEVTPVSIGDPIEAEFDLYYLGGGQDRDQDLVADDLQTKAAPLQAAVAAALLASLAAPLFDEAALSLWVYRRRRRHGRT